MTEQSGHPQANTTRGRPGRALGRIVLVLALIVIMAYILIQKLEEHIFTPTIQGKAVDLPPLVTMLSVLGGRHRFGLLGVILAVPVVAKTRQVLVYLHAR